MNFFESLLFHGALLTTLILTIRFPWFIHTRAVRCRINRR